MPINGRALAKFLTNKFLNSYQKVIRLKPPTMGCFLFNLSIVKDGQLSKA